MSRPRGGARVVLFSSLIGTVVLVVAGLLLWRLLPSRTLGEGLGDDDTSEYVAPDSIPYILPEADYGGIRVAIVENPENAILSEEGVYRRELLRWRTWLEEGGAEMVPASQADVLVVPMGECLGNDIRTLIQRHFRRGGGVVSNGVLGARNANCAAVPDTILTSILGRRPSGAARFTRIDDGHSYILFPGETVLSAGLPAAARLNLIPRSHVVFQGPEREAFFASYERVPQTLGDEPFYDGATARAMVGPGRLVALGFGISELEGGWSETLGRRFLENALRWAAGKPVIQLALWPGGHTAAAMVAQDVEADYPNASDAMEIIAGEAIPTTNFVVGRLARSHPYVTRGMVDLGEIASHSYSHVPMDQLTESDQLRELNRSMSSAQDFSRFAVRGFRPPQERFTVQTLRDWAAIGGQYVFAVDQARAASPLLIPFDADTLVFLGRVTDDDFSLLRNHQLRDRSAMVQTLVSQMDEAIAYRGSYLFSYHSHMLAQEDLLPVLAEVIREIKQRPEFWLATAGEIARWWQGRSSIEIVPAEDGRSVELINHGSGRFSRASLLVDLANGERRKLPVPDLEGGEAVRMRWDQEALPALE